MLCIASSVATRLRYAIGTAPDRRCGFPARPSVPAPMAFRLRPSTLSSMCLGIPAQLVAVDGGLAVAEVSGVRREISTAFTPEAEAGDWVLVHVGFALHTIDEEEAARTLALLEEIEW
jgi:hydrogenase expression/formation protein HypC